MLLRLSAVLLAIVFSLGTLAPSIIEGAGKEPTKPETKQPAKAPATKAAPLDINTASVDSLTALPGINDADAKRIVAGRPYKEKDELVKKGILPQPTYDKIKEQIVARQQKK
jgi:competence protein ComEA